MTTTKLGRLPDPARAGVCRRPCVDRWRWVRVTRAAWRTPGWRRAFAGWALAGALGDLVTTMSIGCVDGLYEANPLAAAGQSFVGSVPVFMLVVTVAAGALLAVLAVRPVDVATRVVWWSVAGLGAAKITVTVLNLVVLRGALGASIGWS